MEQRPKKLLDHVREAIRLKHYSRHTEQAYVTWIKRYIFFHDKRHPKDMGAAEIEAFFDPPRSAGEGRCLHPKPGRQRPAVPLPRRP